MLNLSNLKFKLTLLLMLMYSSFQQLDLKCNVNTQSADIVKGNSYVICIHFQDPVNGLQRASFKITIDQYTALQLITPQINKQTNPYLYIQPQNNNTEFKDLFYDSNSKKIAKLFSFVLYMENGQLQKIQIDNQPFYDGCTQDDKIEYEITNSSEEKQTRRNCFFTPTQGSNTNPKVFISWMGTDKNGQYLLSHTHRISKFSQFSISNVFESAFNIF